jgi:hypothetical protein
MRRSRKHAEGLCRERSSLYRRFIIVLPFTLQSLNVSRSFIVRKSRNAKCMHTQIQGNLYSIHDGMISFLSWTDPFEHTTN